MSIHAGPNIVDDGLMTCLDSYNTNSFVSPTWTDLVTKETGVAGLSNSAVFWMNSGYITRCTLTMIIRRNTANASYSINPFTKYADTTNNTFNWYMFGNFAGAAPASDGNLQLYANRGGVWGGVGSAYVVSLNQTVCATIQYNSTTGGQLWINGIQVGGRSGSGGLGSIGNTSNLVAMHPTTSSIISPYYYSIYNRELSDSEVIQNFSALRGRYGI